ncbi:MAG TPA: hypothetical protein DGG95_04215 [Cytophagales bacterium]|jgi:hypothetical protein|nr:hypothetical protein [Cytophagales bacterium]
MIKKSIFVFLFLFAGYSIYISSRPTLSSSQHFWQANMIKAQKFIYDESDTFSHVIVGSSLAALLVKDSLPSFYNLSFGGTGPFNGLSIIKRKDKAPKNVFIEMNTVLIEERKEFTNSIYSFVPYIMRKYFLSLRADKQPIPLYIDHSDAVRRKIASLCIRCKIESVLNRKIFDSNPAMRTNESANSKEAFDLMLANQIESYSMKPDSLLMKQQMTLVLEYVSYLRSRGSRVWFFEMPINSELVNLPQSKLLRDEIHRNFPSSVVTYIDQDTTSYTTTDGLHLNLAEAIRYTHHFNSKVKKNGNSN